MAFGLAGIVPVLLAGRSASRWTWALLVGVVIVHSTLYIAYVDLLPTGLWRYRNVHYFKPLIPALALLALSWLRQMLFGQRLVPSLSLAFVLAMLSLRIMPQSAAGRPARLAVFAGIDGRDLYFSELPALRDAHGVLRNIVSMRLIPLPQGLGAMALRREFDGPTGWAPGAAPPGVPENAAPALFAERVTVGWPCFLPPYPCRRPR
jgi:hypothetical protein